MDSILNLASGPKVSTHMKF